LPLYTIQVAGDLQVDFVAMAANNTTLIRSFKRRKKTWLKALVGYLCVGDGRITHNHTIIFILGSKASRLEDQLQIHKNNAEAQRGTGERFLEVNIIKSKV
jgi:hypothetical protein